MEAGRNTVAKLLNVSPDTGDDEDEDDIDEDLFGNEGQPQGYSEFRNFSTDEITSLERCLRLLKEGSKSDPKLEAILGYLLGTNPNATERWVDRGCILFSQYYDTVRWVGEQLARHESIPSDLTIGLYAGSNRSGFWLGGRFQRCDRTLLKNRVRSGEIKLLLGTDAASEGLNLQRLGTLINIDLPWNPTRLEQRKGRIQRIGQARNQIWIANLRYRDSVEDKVHRVLAERLQAIHELFGQIPDTLEDVWVKVALNDEAEIASLIDQTTATRNPFDRKYSKVEDAAWETCPIVLNPISVRELMETGWG
jgi:superfamily II DNA/RNA helicase